MSLMPMKSMGELALELDLDRKTLSRWRARGAPFVERGRRVEADRDALKAWASSNGLYGEPGRPHGSLTGCVGPDAKAEVLEQTGAPIPVVVATAERVDEELGKAGDGEGVTGAMKRQLAEAEARKRIATAERMELDLAAKKGRLLDAAEVQRGRLARIAVVRKGLLALPAKLARLPGAPATLERAAMSEVEALLEEFSRG